ncbi:GNAT family N-acetyltransferase [Lysinibacillus sp. CNPSo 3705]|uniref:GNAT family N-acetyltransferase n=1 Tax=Lysinibacillus sp. CNPSo 3705 TaxID=3028148 RepID=UPI0023639DBE|nr:GNAT family N-acetyltransferase [Lysinibacillus sp. CNPSo 3705]MDD1501352.1 GNAT family N-acetyltransferase [Lysinibacillus sp. CNPSo 3705]
MEGAYPGRIGSLQPTKEQLKALFMHNQNNDAAIHYYGLWEDNKFFGGMRLHDFEMNLFSKMMPIGGVGLVAVDLLRKKENVAKELIDHFFKVFFREKCSFCCVISV